MCYYSIICKISLASFHLYPFLLIEDYVFIRNHLEILGGSQYKERGLLSKMLISERGHPRKDFVNGSGQKHLIDGSRGLILNGMAHWGQWRVLHFATKGKAIRNNI